MATGIPLPVSRRLGGFTLSVAVNGLASLAAIPLLVHGAGPAGWASIATGQVVGGVAGAVVSWGWGVVGPPEVAALPPASRVEYLRRSLPIRLALLTPAAAGAAVVTVALALP